MTSSSNSIEIVWPVIYYSVDEELELQVGVMKLWLAPWYESTTYALPALLWLQPTESRSGQS